MWILIIAVITVIVSMVLIAVNLQRTQCAPIVIPTGPQGQQISNQIPPIGVVNPLNENVIYAPSSVVQGRAGQRPVTDPQNPVFIPVNTILLDESPLDVRLEYMMETPEEPLEEMPDLPESFDARDKWPLLITDPMHQGACGSCWAFAAATAISDRFRIAEPNNEELRSRFMYSPFVQGVHYPLLNNISPYYIVSCDSCRYTSGRYPAATRYVGGSDNQCDDGCSGGFIQLVYQYMVEKGAPTLMCQPPGPSPDCPLTDTSRCPSCNPATVDCPCPEVTSCRMYSPPAFHATFDPTEAMTTKRSKVMAEVYTKGPVTVGFKVYQSFYDFFRANPTGIYSEEAQPRNDRYIGGHAVNIMGWGTQDGVLYWLIRNSWGIDWGDRGYFRIKWDDFSIMDQAVDADIPTDPKVTELPVNPNVPVNPQDPTNQEFDPPYIVSRL